MTTKTAAHTPGPWRWRIVPQEGAGRAALLLETTKSPRPFNDPVVLAVREDWHRVGPQFFEDTPDARLIAVAPKLLAIAQEIANDSHCDLVDSERRIRLYAAIMEATGDV